MMSSSKKSFTHSSISSFIPINSTTRTKQSEPFYGQVSSETISTLQPTTISTQTNLETRETSLDLQVSDVSNEQRNDGSQFEEHVHLPSNSALSLFSCEQKDKSPVDNSSILNPMGSSSKWLASNAGEKFHSDNTDVPSELFMPHLFDPCSVAHKKKFHYQRELFNQQQKQFFAAPVIGSTTSGPSLDDLKQIRKPFTSGSAFPQPFSLLSSLSRETSSLAVPQEQDNASSNFCHLPLPSNPSFPSELLAKSDMKSLTSYAENAAEYFEADNYSKALNCSSLYEDIENCQTSPKRTGKPDSMDPSKVDSALPKLNIEAGSSSGPAEGNFSGTYVDPYNQAPYDIYSQHLPIAFTNAKESQRKSSSSAEKDSDFQLPGATQALCFEGHSSILNRKVLDEKHFIDISGHTKLRQANECPTEDERPDKILDSHHLDVSADNYLNIIKPDNSDIPVSNPYQSATNKSLLLSSTSTAIQFDDMNSHSKYSQNSSIGEKGKSSLKYKDEAVPFFPIGPCSSSMYGENAYLGGLECTEKGGGPNEPDFSSVDDLNICLNLALPPYAGANVTDTTNTNSSSTSFTSYSNSHSSSHNVSNLLNTSPPAPPPLSQSGNVNTSLISPSVPSLPHNPPFYPPSFEDIVQSGLPFYPNFPPFSSSLNIPATDLAGSSYHSSTAGKLAQVGSFLGSINVPSSPSNRPINLASDAGGYDPPPIDAIVPHSVAAPIPLQPLPPPHVLAPHPFPPSLPTSTPILHYPSLHSLPHSYPDHASPPPNVHQRPVSPTPVYTTSSSTHTAPTHTVSKILHPSTPSSKTTSDSSSSRFPTLKRDTRSTKNTAKIPNPSSSWLISDPESTKRTLNKAAREPKVENYLRPLSPPGRLLEKRSVRVRKNPISKRKPSSPTKDIFSCPDCSQEFRSSKELHNHKIADHNADVNFECNICKTSFRDRVTLREHRAKQCTRHRHICGFCNKSFGGSSSLAAHRRIHTGDMPYTCEECGKKFRHLATLKSHALVHTGERPFQCTVCSLRFSQRSTLSKHFKNHTSDPKLQCTLCGNFLRDKDGLARHMKMPHFNCETCDNSFCSEKKLELHVVKEHPPDDRPFKCDSCPATFAVRLNYTKHKNSIHRKEDLVCEECGARFKRTDRFNAHKKIHTGGTKIHTCSVCKARFNQRNSLSKHYRALHSVTPDSAAEEDVDDIT